MAAAPIISLADCEAVLNTEEHPDYPDALTQITVKVTHPQHGRVASLEALLIDRSQINPEDFISIMDDESDELQKFAVGVFDSQARIKQRLVDHEHHKGSGCWGAEFNNGRIAYVSTVDVQPPFRRKGLGTLALRKLMDSNLIHQDDFLAAWPTAYPEDEAAMAEITERHDGVVSFFHNVNLDGLPLRFRTILIARIS
ncbi:hypothetical protein NM688_g8954 [Phlebia brevispora]|uniref:Uncharacterized protein n=1 Tax=Phlebia brevispora TaxID=194682 RepID=A0ACC1RLD8_9APHY|nr:hypothetical protein NM688_g8954 [Phlebia brevispora]